MKNSRLTSILSSSVIASAAALGALVSTHTASAQETPLAKANIPFAFQVGSSQMPAGVYQISRESDHLLLLRGPDHATQFVLMHSAVRLSTPDHSSIVFDRYANRYFLRQVWTAGTGQGLECARSRAEKEVSHAENKQAPRSIELALNAGPQR